MSPDEREVTGADPLDVDERSIRDWLDHRVATRGETDAVTVHDGDGWVGVGAEQLVRDVRSLSAGLIGAGLEVGDRVVVMAPTSAEWTLVDLAVMCAGGIVVPVYDSSSEAQCRAVVTRAGPRFAFGATDEHIERLRLVGGDISTWKLDRVTIDEITARGEDHHRAALDERDIGADSIATIVFTSGTTGDPKGVPLTHHQLVWTARQTAHHLDGALGPDQSTLLFLPLAHIFARVVVFAALEAGVEIGYGRSIDDVPEDLRTYRPTFLLAVPRMLDRVVSGARQRAIGWRRPVFDWAMRTARAWSAAESPGPLLRLRHRLADRLVLSTVRDGLGGRVRFAVSGGARLAPALGHAIAGTGITVLEGYGLTETTAPVSVNRPFDPGIGTAGVPIPGVTVRISDDGEILVRGPSVTAGYLNDEPTGPDDTVRPDDDFDGDWFRTGDEGLITSDGRLVVAGRVKDVIVTDGGKNVAPAPLEDALTEHPMVAQAIVVGDERPFVAALVVLADDAPDDPDEQRRLAQRAVDTANDAMAEQESIRRFRIVDRPFSEDDDELTPTLKLRRERITEHFADDIEALYAQAGS